MFLLVVSLFDCYMRLSCITQQEKHLSDVPEIESVRGVENKQEIHWLFFSDPIPLCFSPLLFVLFFTCLLFDRSVSPRLHLGDFLRRWLCCWSSQTHSLFCFNFLSFLICYFISKNTQNQSSVLSSSAIVDISTFEISYDWLGRLLKQTPTHFLFSIEQWIIFFFVSLSL